MSRRRHYTRPRGHYDHRGRGRSGHGRSHGYRRSHHGVNWTIIALVALVIIGIGTGTLRITGV